MQPLVTLDSFPLSNDQALMSRAAALSSSSNACQYLITQQVCHTTRMKVIEI